MIRVSDCLDFIGIDTSNARRRLKSVRASGFAFLKRSPAPDAVNKQLRRLLTAITDLDIAAADLAILVGAIAYCVCPLDLIPDLLPMVGWLDDAAVLAAAINVLESAGEIEA